MKFYEYKSCSTCKKAQKFLESKKQKFEVIPIVENPPTLTELKKMLAFIKQDEGTLKNLFNTSGELYREMKISVKLPSMTETDALKLLSKHGKLIKRPFLLSERFGLVGFNEELWKKRFK